MMLRFGSLPAAIHWIDLPGIARYGMEFALYAPDRRLRLTFPSPFLRNEPAALEIEDGWAGAARAWRTEEVTSLRERVQARARGVPRQRSSTGTAPATAGRDGLRDIALCQAIIDCHQPRRAGR